MATLRIGRPVCSFSHRPKFMQIGTTKMGHLIWIKVGDLVGLRPRQLEDAGRGNHAEAEHRHRYSAFAEYDGWWMTHRRFPARTTPFPRSQPPFPRAPKNEIRVSDQADFTCPVMSGKIFRFSPDPNQLYITAVPFPRRAARDRHGRGTGCDGRGQCR